MIKNISIINTVPMNGGDEALLLSTVCLINKYFPSANISVFGKSYLSIIQYFPNLKFYDDLDYKITSSFPSLVLKVLNKIKNLFGINVIGTIIRNANLTNIARKEYSTLIGSDLIFSSAGGYLHDHYQCDNRLDVFKLLNKKNKKIILLNQSIGPFWKKGTIKNIKYILPKIKLIILRENISITHLYSQDKWSNIVISTDIAFTLYNSNKKLFIKHKCSKVKNIVVAFREWNNSEDTNLIIAKAVKLLNELSNKNDITITFLSTCQGFNSYKDDSKIAEVITSQLKSSDHVTIDSRRYRPIDLIKLYSTFDCYIGMRLHGAILSMLGGTPAFNIGYEKKTEGIYCNLGLQEYQISYEKPVSEWIQKIHFFFSKINEINSSLENIVKKSAREGEFIFKKINT